MAKRQLVLTLIGNAKSAVDALRLTESTSEKLQRTVTDVSKKLALGFAAVGAAGIYMGKQLFDGAMMAVNAAAEDQRGQELLANQIRQTTYATEQQIAAIEGQISKLEYSAAVADDQLRPALANLVRATGNLTDSQTLLQIALDISAATGKDLNDVTVALGKAATGNIGALTRLGIPIDENTKKSKDFNEAIKSVARTFEGASATSVDTFEGRMRQLRIGIDNVIESLGYVLMPIFERMVEFVSTKIVPALQLFVDNLKDRGVKGAALVAIASLGDLGYKGINAVEGITLATLTATRKIVDMGEKVMFIGTLFNLATLNAVGFAKTWGAGFGLDRAKAEIDDALKGLPDAFDALRSGVASASKELGSLTYGSREFGNSTNDIRKETSKTVDLMGDYSGSISKTKNEINKAEKAIQSFNNELDDYNSTVRSSANATLDLKKANDDVAKATKNLETTQNRVKQILKGFGAGSKEAADKQEILDRANRDVERAGYGVEEAVFAVADAERELNDVRQTEGVTPEEIRKAEIALAEAKLSVRDAIDQQKAAVADQTEAQRQLEMAINGVNEGSSEYLELLDELQSAQDAHTAAIERAEDARWNEAKAIQAVKDAEIALAEARGALPTGTTFNPETGRAEEPEPTMFPNFMAAVKALHPNAKALDSKTPVRDARAAFPNLYKEYKEAGRAMAKGGIVTSPFQALIGEAGPEAVIPLDRLGDLGTTNVYVTVNAGMGTDPASVADEIVNVLQKYNRRNGALPLKVA